MQIKRILLRQSPVINVSLFLNATLNFLASSITKQLELLRIKLTKKVNENFALCLSRQGGKNLNLNKHTNRDHAELNNKLNKSNKSNSIPEKDVQSPHKCNAGTGIETFKSNIISRIKRSILEREKVLSSEKNSRGIINVIFEFRSFQRIFNKKVAFGDRVYKYR